MEESAKQTTRTYNHNLWIKSISVAVSLFMVKNLIVALTSIYLYGETKIQGISITFVIAIAIGHAIAFQKKKQNKKPLNWFLWFLTCFGIWFIPFIVGTFLLN